MSPDRRARLVKLIADIDQSISEAVVLVTDPELNDAERASVEAFLEFYRESLDRVETMLSADGG